MHAILWMGAAVLLGCEGSSERKASEPPGDPFGSGPYETASVDSTVTYKTSYPLGDNIERVVDLRVWYPKDYDGPAPVVLVSHGGNGSIDGHTIFEHLGQEFAAAGYLSAHLNHAESDLTQNASINTAYHRWDRPSDVSAVLDALDAGELMPEAFAGTPRLDRIGHLGHS